MALRPQVNNAHPPTPSDPHCVRIRCTMQPLPRSRQGGETSPRVGPDKCTSWANLEQIRERKGTAAAMQTAQGHMAGPTFGQNNGPKIGLHRPFPNHWNVRLKLAHSICPNILARPSPAHNRHLSPPAWCMHILPEGPQATNVRTSISAGNDGLGHASIPIEPPSNACSSGGTLLFTQPHTRWASLAALQGHS